MLVTFLQMFVFGGVVLLALLFIGSADDEGVAAADDGGAAGVAAAMLSIRSLLAGLTMAGAVGALLVGVLRAPPWLAVGGAVLGAVAGAKAWRAALRRMRTFDRDHGVSPDLLVGREGVLTVGINGVNAPGIVQLTLGGLSQEYTAVPEHDGIFREGSRVVVVRFDSASTVIVRQSPYPELSSSP
jgi:membrane protein implicated in regulation of membrane protease activity